ncbi:MAG TPA: addiction module protein [Ramlibacter sp.]|uniref:addiction module protein n=1 Tax=Ramlibacter sp. TaxID=1917967 RepID=UPI002ED32FFB
MADPFADLAERATSLEPEDRVRLVEILLDSLHDESVAEVEVAWEQEIRRRVEAFESGDVETHAAEDVFAEARRIAP